MEVDPTDSGVLRAQFGPSWRAWAWFRRQFTPTSLGAIGFVVIACGTYIVHLREDVVEVTTRVIVLEKQVIPIIQDTSAVQSLRDAVDSQNQRITRLEDDYDYAKRTAGTPPVSHRRAVTRGQ